MPGRPTGSPSRSSPWRGDPDGIDSRRYRAGGAGRSFRRAAILAQSRQESVLDIHGHCNARNNARPELDRWRRDEVRREGDSVEIIREVWYRPAVPRATEHARMALSIVTDATEVPPASARKTSAPEFSRDCALPLSRRPSLARRGISRAAVTVTRRSTSFGLGLHVTIEPTSAMRATPGHVRADRTKSAASARSVVRTSLEDRSRYCHSSAGMALRRFTYLPNGWVLPSNAPGRGCRVLTQPSARRCTPLTKRAGRLPMMPVVRSASMDSRT